MFIYLGMQMAARGRGRGRGRGNGANDPITVEELMQTQNEMMHVFMQHLQQQPPPPPPPVHVRDKRGEFMKGRPPVFTHSADPMEADDWLRAVERQLNTAQCNDMEKVLYTWTASGCSSDMVGVVSSCSSQQCSSYHLVGILQRL